MVQRWLLCLVSLFNIYFSVSFPCLNGVNLPISALGVPKIFLISSTRSIPPRLCYLVLSVLIVLYHIFYLTWFKTHLCLFCFVSLFVPSIHSLSYCLYCSIFQVFRNWGFNSFIQRLYTIRYSFNFLSYNSLKFEYWQIHVFVRFSRFDEN